MTEIDETTAPALVHGGPLPAPAVATLGDALVRAAQMDRPGDIRHLAADGAEYRQSYAGLLDEASHVLAGIRAAGVPTGGRVVLRLAHAPDLLIAFWACVLGGFVPVPVSGTTARNGSPSQNGTPSVTEPLAGVRRAVGDAWMIADEDLAGRAFAHRWLGSLSDVRGTLPDRHRHAGTPDDLALLMLTAGSSGRPKAVMLTHRNIMSRSQATALVRGVDSATRSFNWMPLDHVGGLVMFHIRDVYLGCHQVHAPTWWVLEDPLRWLDAMSRYGSDTTWAPNFAFGIVADRAGKATGRYWDLRHLRYIMNGGEAVKARVARRFLDVLAPYGLSPTAIHPGWGMSETSAGVIDCVFSPQTSSDTDRFVPVGTPHPGVSLRIVDEQGRIQPEKTVGRLQVTGLPVSSGYLDNPEQNRESFTADGWFTTDDLAYVENGVLTVTGRADDVVEVNGTRYHAHEIEAAVEELPFVEPSYTVACTIAGPDGTAGRPAVFFHPRSGVEPAEAARLVRARILSRFQLEVDHIEPVAQHEVPKTGTGKLKRSALARRLAAHPRDHPAADRPLS
ncbi:AMP-binding protein [Streptomyces sp. A3M-1-3]|uniref:AMP-binding protein n=1 Tax=Streptomyces sp. A3M-1-3 TaxID=2962044 RepID=UPI0020B753B4|nr:AMP-binding protein [Streptomyces sp. A3M-1-3]MCP3822717.1 AMP-binding protein [Streptomyces sp. A3M-1-3]